MQDPKSSPSSVSKINSPPHPCPAMSAISTINNSANLQIKNFSLLANTLIDSSQSLLIAQKSFHLHFSKSLNTKSLISNPEPIQPQRAIKPLKHPLKFCIIFLSQSFSFLISHIYFRIDLNPSSSSKFPTIKLI